MILLIYVKFYSFYSGRNSLIDMTNPAEKKTSWSLQSLFVSERQCVLYSYTHTKTLATECSLYTVYTVHYIRVQYMLVLDENVNKLLINKLLRYGKKKKTTFRVNEAITL